MGEKYKRNTHVRCHHLFHQPFAALTPCPPSPLILAGPLVALSLRTKAHTGPYLLLRHGGRPEGRVHRGHAVRGRSGQIFRRHPRTDAAIPRGKAREAAGRNSGVLWTRSESNRVYEYVFLRIVKTSLRRLLHRMQGRVRLF